MATPNTLIPKWTKKVITEMTGRDPLGLSRVSSIITDYLLTGIITTTDRARYYSFYCWALWHIENEEKPSKYQIFVDEFRKREAAMALATIANNPATSPVGVEATRMEFDRGSEKREFNCDFRVLPSNPLGGYGQYYSGSLYELGLTYRPEDGIDRVTSGTAEILAGLFHTSIDKTPYIKNKCFKNRHLSLNDLQKAKTFLTLDALSEPFAKEERQKLREIFLGLNEKMSHDRTILRRNTLSQILYIIFEYERYDIHPNSKEIDWYIVYPTYYYGILRTKNDKSIPYKCPEIFSICRSLWRQYCLQQFLSQAIEILLFSVLQLVGNESSGLTIDEIISNLLQPDFFLI
jgi:hypothetical protein